MRDTFGSRAAASATNPDGPLYWVARRPGGQRSTKGETVTIYLSLVIAVLGGAIYLYSNRPKVEQLGLMSFDIGLLVFLLKVAIAWRLPR